MKATWKGEEDGNSSCTVFGVKFRAGEAVDVSHLAGNLQAKLKANPFFEVDGEPKNKGGRPRKDAASPDVEGEV